MIHQPEFIASYATIISPDIFNELNHKGFTGQLEHPFIHMLVVGLFAHTKQTTHRDNAVKPFVPVVKPISYLVPAFFRSIP